MEEAREQMKFSVVASTRLLAMVRDKVRECAERAGVPDKIVHQVVLAADEAVTNVITHAYDNDGVSEVEIDVSVGDGKITLVIRDTAEFFDMDEVKHRVVDDKVNELILIKNLGASGG